VVLVQAWDESFEGTLAARWNATSWSSPRCTAASKDVGSLGKDDVFSSPFALRRWTTCNCSRVLLKLRRKGKRPKNSNASRYNIGTAGTPSRPLDRKLMPRSDADFDGVYVCVYMI
jgi:hypothetical protein